MDYSKLNLKIGLEIHRQVDSHKLFCKCPSKLSEGIPDLKIKRNLRAVESEVNEQDKSAIFEMLKERNGLYEVFHESSCLVELDEEPILDINRDALKTILTVSKLLKCDIVDDLIIMRKQVLDYSNTSGFQRTGLVARNGYVNVKDNVIEIDGIFIEEDAARKVKQNNKEVVYRIDRLGIPLIEIATAPDIKTPEEARDVAAHIGMLLKSTKGFKSGIGTIRQDLNISIKNGARVELKGVQNLRDIPKIIDNEIKRQLSLKKVTEEVRRVNDNLESDFMRPMPGASRMYVETDIPEINVKSLIKEVKLPKLISEYVKELVKKGLNESLANEIIKKDINLEDYKLDPRLVAYVLIEKPKEIKRRFKLEVKRENLDRVLELLEGKKINKEIIVDVLIDLENDKFDISNYKKIDTKVIEDEVKNLISNGLSVKAMMGILMGKYKGKVSGKELVEIIKKNEKSNNY